MCCPYRHSVHVHNLELVKTMKMPGDNQANSVISACMEIHFFFRGNARWNAPAETCTWKAGLTVLVLHDWLPPGECQWLIHNGSSWLLVFIHAASSGFSAMLWWTRMETALQYGFHRVTLGLIAAKDLTGLTIPPLTLPQNGRGGWCPVDSVLL